MAIKRIKGYGVLATGSFLFVAYTNFTGGKKQMERVWDKKEYRVVPVTITYEI